MCSTQMSTCSLLFTRFLVNSSDLCTPHREATKVSRSHPTDEGEIAVVLGQCKPKTDYPEEKGFRTIRPMEAYVRYLKLNAQVFAN